MDATVSCSAANVGSGMYVVDPRMFVEIVSPSNSGREWNEKLFEYANTLSIEQLVLVESLERYVTSHVRDITGVWQRPIYLTDGTLDFTPIGVKMTLDNIYEGTSLEYAFLLTNDLPLLRYKQRLSERHELVRTAVQDRPILCNA